MLRRSRYEMVDFVIMAMAGRGVMTNAAILAEVEAVCRRFGKTLAPHWRDQVRGTLQGYCPTCHHEYERRGRPGDWLRTLMSRCGLL